MFKKSMLCLALALCMFFPSCASIEPKKEVITPKKEVITPIKVALPEKSKDFFPQENLIEYVIESSIKKIPKEVLMGKKVAFVGMDTNIKNTEVKEGFTKYFVDTFEANSISFVPLEEADVVVYISLELSVDLQNPSIRKVRKEPKMIHAGLELLDETPKPEVEKEKEKELSISKSQENMLIEFSLIVIEKDSQEMAYYDKIVSLNLCNSVELQKKL